MPAALRRLGPTGLLGLLLVLLAGCGGSGPSTPEKPTANGKSGSPPTASIPGKTAAEIEQADADDDEPGDDVADATIEAPKEGTPEWFLREALRLKLEPLPATDDVEKLRVHRRERNLKIISHCEQVVSQTHESKDQTRLFNVAVHNLLDARMQLALQGAAEDIDALYADARALIDRDLQSESAVEASFSLVNLAYNLARRTPEGDAEWIKEFAQQARFFAVTYPKEELRGIPLLFTAARSCELNGLHEEAVASYSLIIKSYPKNQYAPRATTILRRLRLPGNSVQVAGPTLTGEQFALDDLLGRPVLVVFWSTEAKPFQEQLPKVLEAARAHSSAGLQVVGVNLDTDPALVKQYVAKHKLAWPQVFFDTPEQRGWNHPVANFYGVMEIPAYWLVDANGAVVTTTVKSEGLESAITAMLTGKPTEKKPAQAASRESETAPARR